VAGVRKIVCIGLNYRCHAAETGATPPEEPVVFMKDPGCIVGPMTRCSFPERARRRIGKSSSPS
jgi:2-keto-4-pentenoate hydratase/2-oxohepta-3-ene-1,7-dioic acid hydratase in catechol pathway